VTTGTAALKKARTSDRCQDTQTEAIHRPPCSITVREARWQGSARLRVPNLRPSAQRYVGVSQNEYRGTDARGVPKRALLRVTSSWTLWRPLPEASGPQHMIRIRTPSPYDRSRQSEHQELPLMKSCNTRAKTSSARVSGTFAPLWRSGIARVSGPSITRAIPVRYPSAQHVHFFLSNHLRRRTRIGQFRIGMAICSLGFR